MKKYLSLIGALTLSTTGTLSVVACNSCSNSNSNKENNPGWKTGTKYIKQWSQQTSNIAKAIILSKNENHNTNRLLKISLKENPNNISNKTDEINGNSYDNFKKIWGYKNNIEGITKQDFITNSDDTFDNSQIKTKNQIKETMGKIKRFTGILGTLPIINKAFKNNKELNELLNTPVIKEILSSEIWNATDSLKNNPDIIKKINDYGSILANLVKNLDAFNPKLEMGSDYHENDIAKSLFGEDGQSGWLNHYQTTTGFSSEAVKQKSSILQEKNFTNWNQVALLKSSIDLNGFFYQLSGNKLTLGNILDNAIEYNQSNTAVDFNINKVINQIKEIWNPSIENIINLVPILIPIVKYQLLGIEPTNPLTNITSKLETDITKGIINIKDIISKLEEILLTKAGFTKLITNLLNPKSNTEFSLNNYITFDFTSQNQENNKPFIEVISPIKDKVISKFTNMYEQMIEPVMKENYIQDILNKIKNNLNKLSNPEHFQFALSELKAISNILNSKNIIDFLEKLINYKTKNELLEDWTNLWSTLGLQNPNEKEFVKDSPFYEIQHILANNENFFLFLNNIVNAIDKNISDGIDTLISKKITHNLDFTNEKLWSINETTIKFSYNTNLDETTIIYELIDKTKTNISTTYKISIVVQGDADKELGTIKQQVWIKSLIKK